MPALLTATESEAPEQALSRRLRDLRQIAAVFRRSRTKPLHACQAILGHRTLDLQTRSFFAGLPADEKHYWIASLYALLMPEARRRRLAAYFTPPHLAHYAIETLVAAALSPVGIRYSTPHQAGLHSWFRWRPAFPERCVNAVRAPKRYSRRLNPASPV
jgi:hypothetical protein